jgi:hypothetical protein
MTEKSRFTMEDRTWQICEPRHAATMVFGTKADGDTLRASERPPALDSFRGNAVVPPAHFSLLSLRSEHGFAMPGGSIVVCPALLSYSLGKWRVTRNGSHVNGEDQLFLAYIN